MADTIKEFFQELVDRGHQPLLAKVRGTVRFDLVGGDGAADNWLVAVDHGDLTISQDKAAADCTIRADKALFERLIQGGENAIAATLRGALVCDGDVELLFAIQRLFPGPPSQRQTTGEAMESR
jgi:predicted lipid carrier protein YhbT